MTRFLTPVMLAVSILKKYLYNVPLGSDHDLNICVTIDMRSVFLDRHKGPHPQRIVCLLSVSFLHQRLLMLTSYENHL